MSRPRYTVRESAQTISPSTRCASAIAARVFPTAVGPATTMTGPWSRGTGPPRVSTRRTLAWALRSAAAPAAPATAAAPFRRGGLCARGERDRGGGRRSGLTSRRRGLLMAGRCDGLRTGRGAAGHVVVQPRELARRRSAVQLVERAVEHRGGFDGLFRVRRAEQRIDLRLTARLGIFVPAFVVGQRVAPGSQRREGRELLAVLVKRAPRLAREARHLEPFAFRR